MCVCEEFREHFSSRKKRIPCKFFAQKHTQTNSQTPRAHALRLVGRARLVARPPWPARSLARPPALATDLRQLPVDAFHMDQLSQPTYAEPADAEPAVAEPAVAEPAVAEPTDAEPADEVRKRALTIETGERDVRPQMLALGANNQGTRRRVSEEAERGRGSKGS